jgi:hypothetical protein
MNLLMPVVLSAMGCALEVHSGGDMTVAGPALVSEVRLLHPGQRRAARIVSVRTVGLAPSLGGSRTGLSIGACCDTRFEVYSYEAFTAGLQAWISEAPPSSGVLIDERRSRPTLFTQVPRPPDVRELARFCRVGVVGTSFNLVESILDVSAGYSASSLLLADLYAPDVAFLYSPDGAEIHFLPNGNPQ